MTHMTQEEKAKAYDYALEILHKYDGAHIMFTQDLKEEMFPELKESEDERIRKALIQYLRDYPSNLPNGLYSRDDFFIYLEKQKAKERLDRMAPIYNNKESFESALEKAWKYYNECGSRTVDSFEDDYIECVFSKGFREGFLYKEKQKEQKSIPSREMILGIWELGNIWKENSEERDGLTQLQYIQKYWDEKCDYHKEQKPEHFELKAGRWYICHRAFCCRADSLTVKEGERFMCEKDGVVKGFIIKEPEKYFIECSAPAPMEKENEPMI